MVLGVIYSQSPLSKVSSISIVGNYSVAKDDLIKLSGLSTRTSFWNLDKEKIISNLSQHDEIEEVNVIRKLPNHVVIDVKELKRVAYVKDGEGKLYPILENGKTLRAINNNGQAPATDAPLLVGWEHDGDIAGLARELRKLPESIANSISEIHHAPKEVDRLHVTLYMNNGYEVSVTVRGFAEKMLAYPTVVNELDPSLKGVIHLDVVPFFEKYKSKEEKGEVTSETEG